MGGHLGKLPLPLRALHLKFDAERHYFIANGFDSLFLGAHDTDFVGAAADNRVPSLLARESIKIVCALVS
jgi:hypothetical protein